jgi:hypothetical protein
VTWRDLTVTKDGGTPTALEGGAGVSLVRAFSASSPGLYVVRVTMDDAITAPVTVVSHFTVPGKTQQLPRVEKNVDPGQPTVLSMSDVPTLPGSIVTVKLPPLGDSEDLVLSVAATAIPSAFGSGINFDARVYHHGDGSLITDFSANPLEIRVDNVSSNFVPYTSSDGVSWTRIGSIPSRTLPDDLPHGAFRDGKTVYIYTRHLSHFALLTPKAKKTKLVVSISATPLKHRTFMVRAKTTLPATIRGDLYSAKNVHLHAWHFKANTGVSTIKLRWPGKVRARGVYKLVWLATANGQVTKRTTKIRLR